jgi:hypothetical protein
LFDRNGSREGLTANPKVISASFSEDVLINGNNSEVLEISDSELVVLRVAEHNAEVILPLSEVRDRVISDIKFMRGGSLTEKAGKEILAELRSGRTFVDIASGRNVEWLNAEGVTRTDISVNRAILRTAFRMGRPREQETLFGGVALGTGEYAVIAILAAHDPDPASIKEVEIKNIQNQLQSMRTSITWQEYLAEMKRKADIRIFKDRI